MSETKLLLLLNCKTKQLELFIRLKGTSVSVIIHCSFVPIRGLTGSLLV